MRIRGLVRDKTMNTKFTNIPMGFLSLSIERSQDSPKQIRVIELNEQAKQLLIGSVGIGEKSVIEALGDGFVGLIQHLIDSKQIGSHYISPISKIPISLTLWNENENLVHLLLQPIGEKYQSFFKHGVFEQFCDNIPIAIQILDVSGFTIKTNNAFKALLGATPSSDFNFFTNEHALPEQKKLFQSVLEGNVVEFPEFDLDVSNSEEKESNAQKRVRMRIAPIRDFEQNIVNFAVFYEDVSEIHSIVLNFKESDERYRTIFEFSPLGIIRFNNKGTVTDVNEALIAILGSRRERLIGLNLITQLTDQNIVKGVNDALLGKISSYEGYYHPVTGDKVSYLRGHLVGITNFYGVITSGIGIFEDATQAKKIAEKLAKSEEQYRQITENVFDMISLIDFEGRFIYCNQSYTKTLGYRADYLVGTIAFNLVHPEDRPAVRELLNSALELGEGEYSFTIRLFTKGKDVIIVEHRGTILLDENHKPVSILIVARDITQKVENEKLLSQTLETYRGILDSISEAVYIQDEQGTFVDVNKGATKIYRCKKEDLIGKNLVSVSAPGMNDLELVKKKTEDVFKTGIPYRFNFWAVRGNGEIFPKDVIINKGVYFGKDVLIATSREISEQIKMMEELRVAKDKAEESDRLKTAFLANMSHELRTPMNGILGFLDILTDIDLTKDEKDNYARLIEKSKTRLLNTLTDIIEISRIESGQLQVNLSEVDIYSILDYHLQFYRDSAAEKGLELILNTTGLSDDISFISDKQKIHGILSNLINNAIKFTNKGKIQFGCSHEFGYLNIYVKDTGIGIPKNRRDSIFERFVQGDLQSYSRPYEGSGLGLAIVKEYVNILNGSIILNSEEGVGTEFFIKIPMAHIPKEVIQEIPKTKTQIFSAYQSVILIAEDDETSFEYLKTVLLKEGFTVIRAIDGEDAVKQVKENPTISLVLMDIKMPRMSGIQATRLIREFDKRLPIIAQTAFAYHADKEQFLYSGCNDFISKPISRKELFGLIYKYIEKSH